jgi:hypothetical protein
MLSSYDQVVSNPPPCSHSEPPLKHFAPHAAQNRPQSVELTQTAYWRCERTAPHPPTHTHTHLPLARQTSAADAGSRKPYSAMTCSGAITVSLRAHCGWQHQARHAYRSSTERGVGPHASMRAHTQAGADRKVTECAQYKVRTPQVCTGFRSPCACLEAAWICRPHHRAHRSGSLGLSEGCAGNRAACEQTGKKRAKQNKLFGIMCASCRHLRRD